jgi:hypothetical protein
MTTKTTINLSPIKRCHGSANLKRRRPLSLVNKTNISSMNSLSIISCEKQILLPDLIHDIFIEQQRRETIVQIANTLRKVGDQMDEQFQVIRYILFFLYKYLSKDFLYLDKQHFIININRSHI